MTQLFVGSLSMPSASLGGESPLTPLHAYETASSAGATAGTGDYPDRGHEASILPYRLQDQYDRVRRPQAFKTIVLENDILRATFLPEVGGRLWSLFHKLTDRELLYVNPVFQPANLAVRDAWFTGGVEWNIGIIGHCPFTCSPLFAARVLDDDGTPFLRMYEWERTRRVPFQIDFRLPDGSEMLLVRVKICNPNDHTVPMYWWSNIAVPENPAVRVLAPAPNAYRHNYDGHLVEHDIPMYDGVDVTYTTNRGPAADLYFRIPDEQRPWIAALDENGRGLVQTSTDRLHGRKMFNWGVDSGGRRWQEFLSQPGQQAYLEIQGGLAPTQGEYVPMPAHAQWEWLEAYGLMEADPAKVHGKNWDAAYQQVSQTLEHRLPHQWMNNELARSAAAADRAPNEILHMGSGWGALERHRRAAASEAPFASVATPFPDQSMTAEQAPWQALLNHAALSDRDPSTGPGSLMVQPQWKQMLEQSVRDGKADHWLAWYHLGVMRYRAADHAGAQQAWETSLARHPSPWATRDLAVLARDAGDRQKTAELLLAAVQLMPRCATIAIECASALLAADRHEDVIAFTDTLPDPVREHGRIRLARAKADLATGNLPAVQAYFERDLDIANVREKETSLSDLWFGWHEQRLAHDRGRPVDDALRKQVRKEFPPPSSFDFRLNVQVD